MLNYISEVLETSPYVHILYLTTWQAILILLPVLSLCIKKGTFKSNSYKKIYERLKQISIGIPYWSERVKEFTREELSKYDGKKSKDIYIAYKGKVYDLTDSGSWMDGEHYAHEGGLDLTEQMDDASHGDEVFEGYKVVGELVD